MSDFKTVKNQIQKLIDTANEKTGKADADLTGAVGSLVEGYGAGSDVEIIMAETVAFSPEHSDTTALYAMGYNWYADLVGYVQDMSGSGKDMKPDDIIYWLGRVKYIPQWWASSEFTLDFDGSAYGILPNVAKRVASSEFILDFETSAIGVLIES
jgi:hypothetical protein